MLSSRPTRWILAFVCSSLIVAGCATSTDTPQGETGSLSVDLVIADGIVINQVGWQITGNGMDMSGDIDVSAPGSTASVEVFGLPPGEEDYRVMLTATSVDEEVTCKGSADFNVKVGETTDVLVMLNCKLPQRFGAVRVNGEFNICAELIKAVVSPLQTSVGNDIDLAAQAIDQDSDPITYSWTDGDGSFADPSAPSTTYTCLEVGDHEITISVTDNDDHCNMAEWTILVTCVEDDGGTGGTGGDGGAGGEGGAGGMAGAGGEGGAGGAGGAPECTMDADCDIGEICVGGVCRGDPGLFCDTRLCAEDAGLKAACVEAFLLCLAENPREEECVALALLICNECNGDQDCNEGFVCDVNNECVLPLECTDASQCDEDGNPCTAAACENNTCGQVPTNEGGSCDSGTGSGDGSCNAGTCDSNDQCTVDGQCSDDDGNECTAPVCVQTSAPYLCDEDSAPADGNECNDGAGTCDGGSCVAGCTVPAPVDALGIPMACRNSFQVKAVSEFPIDLLNIDTGGDCIEAGQPVNFDMDPVIALDTAFLQAAANTLCGLGTPLTQADITVAQVAVDAIAGATCTEQLSELPDTPVTVILDATVEGTCGAGGSVTINSGVSVPLPPLTLPCTAGAAGTDAVQICSVGETPIQSSIDLATTPVQTFMRVSVGGGTINIQFQCGTSSTTNPPPGVDNQIGCFLPNTAPAGNCDTDVGEGNTGEELPGGGFPVSECDFLTPPATPIDCGGFDCTGTCTTVPIAVDPATVCALFTVQ